LTTDNFTNSKHTHHKLAQTHRMPTAGDITTLAALADAEKAPVSHKLFSSAEVNVPHAPHALICDD
jgi:hypothetical protein